MAKFKARVLKRIHVMMDLCTSMDTLENFSRTKTEDAVVKVEVD